MTRSIGDVLSGRDYTKARHSGQPVWRNSYYEGTFEDRIWRPFMDGNVRGAKRRIGAIMKSVREYERKSRRTRQRLHPGVRNGVIGQIGLDVLEVLYSRFLDYRTGRLEPAIATIAEAIGHSYGAVHKALRRLREAGFLHWVRRSRPTDNAGIAGPQVEQVPNAYVLMLPEPIEKMVRHLVGRPPAPQDEAWRREQAKKEWQDMLDGLGAEERLRATWNGDALLGETLARLAKSVDERESCSDGETGAVLTSLRQLHDE